MPSDEKITLRTIPFDPRFPQQNQTLACFANYVDYHRCMDLLDGDKKCEYLRTFFEALCPNAWIAKWDEQQENGNFPHPICTVPRPKE